MRAPARPRRRCLRAAGRPPPAQGRWRRAAWHGSTGRHSLESSPGGLCVALPVAQAGIGTPAAGGVAGSILPRVPEHAPEVKAALALLERLQRPAEDVGLAP